MAGVNKVILVGNLGKDPEIRHLEGGAMNAKFSIATTESYKDKSGQRVDQTEWHNVIVWRERAEFAEKYLKKGMTIYLEGKIRNRSWDDKDGVKHYITEISADNITIIKRPEGGANTTPTDDGNPSIPKTGDDLPF